MAWKMSTILLPLLCVVWQGIVFSGALETYQVPIRPVTNNPFEAIYQYPMEGNGFKKNEDGTKVFWPAYRKIHSKFYINLDYENETFFGISEQAFLEADESIAGASMSTNDHLAFVKVEGPWNDDTSEKSELIKVQQAAMQAAMDQMSLEERLKIQQTKIDLYFKWFHVANISTLLHEQAMNPAQIMAYMQYAPYNSDLEKKLLAEMDAFSSSVSQADYQQFDKSAFMCLHVNPAGIKLTKEEDGTTGWWMPLEKNFIAWRSMAYQQPLSAFRTTAGLMSMTIDQSGNLNAVFKGTQLWRTDIDGIDWTNNEVAISPPNELPDLRPKPPSLPLEPFATLIREGYKALPNDYNLPWLPRDQLCSKEDLESRFAQLNTTCGYPINPTDKCRAAFADFYPCFNFLLRPSKNHDHGMDSFVEFTVLLHIMTETPPSYWKTLAIDEPWNEEFAHAIDILGLDV